MIGAGMGRAWGGHGEGMGRANVRVGQPHTSPLLQGHTHSHLYLFTLIPPPCCRVTLVLEFKAGKEDEEAAKRMEEVGSVDGSVDEEAAKRMDEVSCLGGCVCTALGKGCTACYGLGCAAWGLECLGTWAHVCVGGPRGAVWWGEWAGLFGGGNGQMGKVRC